MIGAGLKKLATESGMKVSNGVAYGSLSGYATTMSEGNGYKRITITTHFTDVERKNALLNLLNESDLSKEYRVKNLEFFVNGIDIIFLDNPGTMKKITAFIEWFYPLLSEYTATGVQHCTQCGCDITDAGSWKLIDGIAYHFHAGCANKVESEIDAEFEQKNQEKTGSYITGFIGAIIGALLGSVVWAIVLNIGYVASIVGFVIGWLAEKGYSLLKGKNGKGKMVILIIASIFGVVIGTFGAEVLEIIKLIGSGEVYGLVYADIPLLLMELLNDSEFMGYMISNIGLGLIFACLGCFSIVRKAGKETSKTKVIDLK